MKKLLFTTSLLLVFTVSSNLFANTNEKTLVKEARVEYAENNEDDACRTETYRWTEVVCNGPEDDPDSYTIYFNKLTITTCDDYVG
jgi:hypothetical protein